MGKGEGRERGSPVADEGRFLKLLRKRFSSKDQRVREAALRESYLTKSELEKIPEADRTEAQGIRLAGIEALISEFTRTEERPEETQTKEPAPEVPVADQALKPKVEKAETARIFSEGVKGLYDQLERQRREHLSNAGDREKRELLKQIRAEYRQIVRELADPSLRKGKSHEEVEYEHDILVELLRDFDTSDERPGAKMTKEPEPEIELEPALEPVEEEPELIEEEPRPEALKESEEEELEMPEAPEVAFAEPEEEEDEELTQLHEQYIEPIGAPSVPKMLDKPRLIDRLRAAEARAAAMAAAEAAGPTLEPSPERVSEPGAPEDEESEYGSEEDETIELEAVGESTPSYLQQFIAREFRGEVTPEMERQGDLTKLQKAKAVGFGLLSAAASYVGMKAIADLPRYATQLHFTRKERERLKAELMEEGPETPEDEMDLRIARIQAAIESSKHLTAQQKAELFIKVK